MKRFNRFGTLLCMLAAGLSLVACGLDPSSAAGGPSQVDLDVVLDAPPELPDGDTVEVTFTLTNHSDVDLYVLKWYTPLEGLGGKIFRVERDGQPVPYQGPLAMRGDPGPESYVFLGAGESTSAVVDLAMGYETGVPAYDFTKPGTYTISFLSPKISAVARSEDEMATSVDDLGPVEMPSNEITIEITGPTGATGHHSLAEAEKMIRKYLHSQKPNLDSGFDLLLQELPVRDVWEELPVHVFQAMDGPFARESFLISDDTVLQLGTAMGGRGVTSMEVSDLDRDGTAEVFFAYSFGSGIHQTRFAMYAPAYAEDRIYECGTAYLGDAGLVNRDDASMEVKLLESDAEAMTLRYSHTLGHLVIDQADGQVRLKLQVAENLPDEVLHKLVDISGAEEPRADRGYVGYEGIRFVFDPTIAAQVVTEAIPATGEGGPAWAVQPAHVQFSLEDYILPETFHQPRILFYPVPEFEAASEPAASMIAQLRQLLRDMPGTPATIPFLPPFNAEQLVRARVTYLDFEGGRGVRFLTQYAQAYAPINNFELFYTFQGLTDDGQTYVAAILPVSHPELPENQAAYEGHLDGLAEEFASYLTEVEKQLNLGPTSDFTPDLIGLDAMMRSLEIDPTWTTALPSAPDTTPVPGSGWETYENEDYAFAFRYPVTWALEEAPNLVTLSQGQLVLAIAFRRPGEDVAPPWTGMPAGEIKSRGTMTLLGQEIEKKALVYGNEVKGLTYHVEADDLIVSIRLDDVVETDYEAIAIPEGTQSEVDQIVASFERQ